MRKNLKRTSAVMLAGLLAVTQLSGCAKISSLLGKGEESSGPTYEELQSQIATLNGTVVKYENQITSLKELLYTYDSTLTEVADLNSVRRLPTGQKAYNGINNYIRLGEQLELKPSMVLPNDTTIQLVKNVTYKPTNNWSFDLSNGTVSLLHKNGMYVTLRAYDYIGDATPYDAYTTVIKPYLDRLAVSEINRRTLFMKDQTVGTLVFNQCYVIETDGKKSLKVPETEPEIVETQEETTVAQTDENGNPIETLAEEESAETPTAEIVDNTAPVVQAPADKPVSLDDLLSGGTQESGEGETDEDPSESTEDVTNNTEEGQESTEAETEAQETKAAEKKEEPVREEKITEYRYVVGIVLDGSTGIIFEAFYPNDDTASIQEELLETCLNGLYIRGNQLKSQ